MLKNEANAQKNIKKEFYPLIIHNNNGYCVYLPEWRISGTGISLDEAYRKFEQNFKAIEEHAEMFGLATLTPEPYPQLKKRAILQDLALFYIKVASSALIVILSIVLLLPNISAAVRNSLKEMLPKEIIPIEMKDPKYWALRFPEEINTKMDKLKPEEEKIMKKEWNKLLNRTLPILNTNTCK